MHDIITSKPGYAELVQRRKRLAAANTRHQRRIAEWEEQHRRALVAYHEERKAAVLRGEDPPEPPTPGRLDPGDAMVLITEERDIAEAERLWFREHAEDIGRDVAAHEAQLIEGLSPLITRIEDAARELSSLADIAQRLNPGTARDPIDVLAVVRAVARGHSVLQPPERQGRGFYFHDSGARPEVLDAAEFQQPPTEPLRPDHRYDDQRLTGRR